MNKLNYMFVVYTMLTSQFQINIFCQVLFKLASKSFSHTFAAIAKFHPLLKVICIKTEFARKTTKKSYYITLFFSGTVFERGGSDCYFEDSLRNVEEASAVHGGDCRQAFEDADCGVCVCCQLDLFQGHAD